jgi:DNA-binding NtrC family response regulator
MLIASQNDEFREKVLGKLRSAHRHAEGARGGAEALAMLETGGYRVLLLDRWLPDLDVGELSKMVREQFHQVEVFVVGSDPTEACPLGINAGPEFCSYCAACDEGRSDSRVVVPLVEANGNGNGSKPVEPLPGMIGASCAMRQVYRLARLVTARSTPVLVVGETGTGKELVARAIHQLGPRARQPMVTVNCAAIPEPLLEAELFGHARGAFTGAIQSRLGRIQAAHGGTLFLDEVGEVPLNIQAKLLRFLQEGEVQRLGSPDVIRVDVRVIAATNADLTKLIGEGRFREDLYYRLMVFPITLAPLRAHPEDILPLANFFLSALCQEVKVPPKVISREAGELLKGGNWPGNIRELRHKIERAFILSEDHPELLPEHVSL